MFSIITVQLSQLAAVLFYLQFVQWALTVK